MRLSSGGRDCGLDAGADNNLVLNHRELSRQHMRFIWRDDDKYLIEDLNSSNGVWFNDARIPPRVPQVLTEGDIIRCGPYLFTFAQLIYPEVGLALPQEARIGCPARAGSPED